MVLHFELLEARKEKDRVLDVLVLVVLSEIWDVFKLIVMDIEG